MFLSKAEWDYLTSKRQFDDDYSYTIKSRLAKKINQFANQELPLLIEKGYLTNICKLTDICKVQQGEGASLVKIPPQAWQHSGDLESNKKEEWAESDSNQRSPPCQGGNQCDKKATSSLHLLYLEEKNPDVICGKKEESENLLEVIIRYGACAVMLEMQLSYYDITRLWLNLIISYCYLRLNFFLNVLSNSAITSEPK